MQVLVVTTSGPDREDGNVYYSTYYVVDSIKDISNKKTHNVQDMAHELGLDYVNDVDDVVRLWLELKGIKILSDKFDIMSIN